MTIEDLHETYPGMLIMEDHHDAFVGVVTRFGIDEPIACYDVGRILSTYQERDGMTYDEAVEYFDHNVIGAWAGDRTPCFIYLNEL
jgi:hypothetical protein